MMNRMNRYKGSISIFLTLIMLPMFIGAGFVIDGARVSAARIHVSGAGDLAMNAALSEFDPILKDIYGLFAMSKSTEELQEYVRLYFNNTINNTGILQGSDSYTRSFINSIGSLFSSDELAFDNIVDTQSDSFKLIEIPRSALGNPFVLERQIVEYMKYRGPVNLASSILKKIGVFGETSKQTKAIEKKIEYDQKLDSVQEACVSAYKKINRYNDLVQGDVKNDVTTALKTARTEYALMTEYTIAANSHSTSVNSLVVNSSLNNSGSSYASIASSLRGYINMQKQSNGTYKNMNANFQQKYETLAKGAGDTLDEQIAYVLSVNDIYDDYTKVYTYLDALRDSYSKLDALPEDATDAEIEARDELNREYTFFMSYRDVATQVEEAVKLKAAWRILASTHGSIGSQILNDTYTNMTDISQSLKESHDALTIVIKKVDELATSRENWGKSLDDLAAGDVKTSMKGDYASSAKDLNRDSVETLKSILAENKQFFDEVIKRIDEITFYNEKVNDPKYASTDYFQKFYREIGNLTLSAAADVHTQAQSILDAHYTDRNLSGITPADYTVITGASDAQQFYRYLKSICTSLESDSTEKSENQEMKKNLVEAGNGDSQKTADTASIAVGNIIGSAGLPDELSDAIDLLSEFVNDASRESFDPDNLRSNGKDSDIADTNKKNLSKISEIIKGLTGLLAAARDRVYIEEYITEMFSCYTSDKDTKGAAINDPKAMNNKPMKDNAFFKSEVEYILWGNNDVQKNLDNTKALIFGIRLVMNAIYAFASSHTRTPALTAATAIAGWTGFGVPIVQTVILLAWAVAESIVDVKDLCDGKAVVIYKSANTWVLDFDSAVKKFKDDAVEKIKTYAGKAVDGIFEKLNNTAADTIDTLGNDINDFVAETTGSAVETVVGAVITPIQQFALSVIGESHFNLTESEIADRYDTLIDDLESLVADETSGLIKEAKLVALGALRGSIKTKLVNAVYSCYSEVVSGATDAVNTITEKIMGEIKNVENEIKTRVENTVNEAAVWLKDEFKSITQTVGATAKDELNKAIDSYSEKLTGSIPGDVDMGIVDKTSTSASLGLTLTYKEYLKLFVLMYSILDATRVSMLTRTAKLIQCNISKKNASFDISKAFTLVEINAAVSVKTTFFNVPVASSVDSNGKTTYDFDFSRIGADRLSIGYVGLNGY